MPYLYCTFPRNINFDNFSNRFNFALTLAAMREKLFWFLVSYVPILSFTNRKSITMKKQILISFLVFYTLTSYSQSIQDIQPEIWFRADIGMVDPAHWNDISGHEIHATSTQDKAPSADALINFNPALQFDGIDDYLYIPYDVEQKPRFTFISVFCPEDSLDERVVWKAEQTMRDITLTSRKIKGYKEVTQFAESGTTHPIILSVSQYWGDAFRGGNPFISIGTPENDTSTLLPFKGCIPEYLVFDRALGEDERLQFETYLALKYGISLANVDYKSSENQVIWSAEENASFSNNLFGIGRDDYFGLYQKQSASSQAPHQLVISIGAKADNNAQNPGTLEDRNFLIYGDNGLSLEWSNDSIQHVRPLLRRWLVQASGESINTAHTEVRIAGTSIQVPDSLRLWLVVDRSSVEFEPNSTDYYPAEYDASSDQYVFQSVQWDTDASAQDYFTLAIGPKVLNVVKEVIQPSCVNPAEGKVHMSVEGGTSPYNLSLASEADGFTQNWTAYDNFIPVQGLPVGSYTLETVDANGYVILHSFQVTNPEYIALDLPDELFFQTGGTLDLHAETYLSGGLNNTYEWTSDGGYYRDQAVIEVNASGVYHLTVTSENGCTATDKVLVNHPHTFVKQFAISPNPSNGKFHVFVLLKEASDIQLRVHDQQGETRFSTNGTGSDQYHFDINIDGVGEFYVELQSDVKTQTKKIVLVKE